MPHPNFFSYFDPLFATLVLCRNWSTFCTKPLASLVGKSISTWWIKIFMERPNMAQGFVQKVDLFLHIWPGLSAQVFCAEFLLHNSFAQDALKPTDQEANFYSTHTIKKVSFATKFPLPHLSLRHHFLLSHVDEETRTTSSCVCIRVISGCIERLRHYVQSLFPWETRAPQPGSCPVNVVRSVSDFIFR